MMNIDVIIPVWNRAHTIGQAIDSALSQRLPPNSKLTVTVVDDGSSDNLPEVLGAYGERVSCIRHSKNIGAAAARNTGIAATHGEYLAFLDSDDVWLPGKLAKQIDFMQAGGYLASCTSSLLVRRNGAAIVAPRYPTGPLKLADLVWGCFVSPGSTLICKRDVYQQVGDYDAELSRLEDWDWLLRYALRHQLGFLSEPMARIELSVHPDPATVFAALKRMEDRHLSTLSGRERRLFKAAIEVVRAATYQRRGAPIAAASAVIKSLWLARARNIALATVLHNHFARR